jgi:hypothetical protein
MRYTSLYDRLVANTVLEHEDNPQSCWLWAGHAGDRYPKLCVRIDGQPRNVYAHRTMLEEVHDVLFPHDEAGHLCGNPRCVNPDHLEIQTRAHNMAEQGSWLGRAALVRTDSSWLPVLYPRRDDPPF